MRNLKEVLAFLDEQIWYQKQIAKDNGIEINCLFEINELSEKNIIQNIKNFETIKMFIKEEI